jgi:predicted nuclease of predicted toxin-antitoxin system
MRLLFDQNLAPGLVARLADLFPGSSHTERVGLAHATDDEVWEFARSSDFILVSKDADFGDLAALRGHPPKVLWLRLGNCTTAEVEALLRSSVEAIRHLYEDAASGILALS